MSNRSIAWLERLVSITDRSKPFFRALTIIATGILLALGCLICVDVILRYVFNSPLQGVSQITGLVTVLFVFFSIAYAQQEKAHISIDLLTQYLSPKGKVVLNNILYVLSICIISLTAWKSFEFVQYFKAGNITVVQLGVVIYPFAALATFGLATLALMLIRDFLQNIAEGLKLQLGIRLWLLSFGILLLVIAGMIYWVLSAPWAVNFPVLGVIGLLFTILFFFTGMPISFALLLFAFLFLTSIKGPEASLTMLGYAPFRVLNTYMWAVIALFVSMGYAISAAGLGEDLYYTAYKWLGRLPGGLAQATIAASAAFAAVASDVISACVVFGKIAYPEMRRYNYDNELSLGAICLGATLGPMIPPSITFIVYGLVTNQSIGTLFIAGIVPGVFVTVASMLYVYIICLRNPNLGPRGPSSSFVEKIVSLRLTWPIIILFILCIGGIYVGIFTPNEGGAIGVGGSLIIGLILRRFSRQNFTNLLLEAGKLMGMLFFLIVGAILLGYFIAASDVSTLMKELLTGGNIPPVLAIILMGIIYLILGCFMDAIAIMLITLPIFYPIAMGLGYDPIWFGVIVALLVNLGCVTPPFGIICFALKEITGQPLATVFRSITPFVIITIVVVALIIAFPQIAIFLPNLLK